MAYDRLDELKARAHAKAVQESREQLLRSIDEIMRSPCLSPLGPVWWSPQFQYDFDKVGDVYFVKTAQLS